MKIYIIHRPIVINVPTWELLGGEIESFSLN